MEGTCEIDSPVEEAVRSELLSGRPNSLLAGKIQGISSTLASVARICRQNGDYNQSFTSKFPTRQNRELIGPYQGIKSAYQGSFLPDQGRALGWGVLQRESENRKLIGAD
jgi:hypothetical protein